MSFIGPLRALERPRRDRRAGLTLVELIVAFTILLLLSTMALPLTRIKVQREKERRLRMALEDMRTAIDRYKDAADQGLLGDIDPDNHGYPESLEILVEGVEVTGGPGAMGGMSGMSGMSGMPGMGGQQGLGGSRQGMAGSRQGGFGNQGNSSFGNRQGGFGSSSSFGSNRSQGSSFGSRSGSGAGSSGRTGFGSQGGFGSGLGGDEGEKKMRFLRRIPEDPITGTTDWGLRSVSDDPNSMSWSGSNVFDVYSLSMDVALDGTRYSEW